MKRLIVAASTLSNGSYLLDRDGNIISVKMHAPSTTYLNRGILHLCPCDGQFLLDQGLINEDGLLSILIYCFAEYLQDEEDSDDRWYSMMSVTKFQQYAELNYAPTAKQLMVRLGMSGDEDTLAELSEGLPDFDALNRRWYTYLLNSYVKISVIGRNMEFRINSEDGFDWNEAIIDHVICNPHVASDAYRFTIVRESSKGYQAYFMNATRSEVLSKDKVVLSSIMLTRKEIVYSDGSRRGFYKLSRR